MSAPESLLPAELSVPAARRLARGSAFDTARAARREEALGRDVVHLELGQPDLPSPPSLARALAAALSADGGEQYTPPAGDPVVRGQVAEHYSTMLGVPVDPERVLLLPGSNLALHLTLQTAVAPGEEVLLPDPGFPAYAELVRLAGAVPVGYRLTASTAFVPDVDELAALMTPRTRLIVVNSPHNPTGGVLPCAVVERITALADSRGLYVLFDEAYRELIHDGSRPAALGASAAYSRTVVMDSLSKSHSLCGWRIGVAVVPRELAEEMAHVVVNTHCCMPSFVQRVIPTALGDEEWVARIGAEYRSRRDLVAAELAGMPGLWTIRPEGGLYAFPDISATGLSDRVFADRLLREAGVAVVPGSVFGRHGAGHVRVAFTQPRARLAEGMSRIRTFLEEL